MAQSGGDLYTRSLRCLAVTYLPWQLREVEEPGGEHHLILGDPIRWLSHLDIVKLEPAWWDEGSVTIDLVLYPDDPEHNVGFIEPISPQHLDNWNLSELPNIIRRLMACQILS